MRVKPKFQFAVPVWGDSYVRTFLQYSLPSQLAPENIPSLEGQHSYTIYTTNEDRERIASSEAFKALQRTIEVDIHTIESVGQKYDIKSNCYRQALHRAAQRGAAVFLLNADIVLADGFVQKIVTLLSSGKRVIEVPGPRGILNAIGRELEQWRDGIAINISPIALGALWFKNIHPLLRMHFVEGEEGAAFHPSHLYWSVAQEGIVARCFHLYPIVVYPKNSPADFTTTIDDDLVGNLAIARREIFLAQDSRDLFCCELSPPEQYVGDIARRGNIDRYVDFYASHSGHNIRNLEKEIIISGVRILGPDWRSVRLKSKLFARDLIRRYRWHQFCQLLRRGRGWISRKLKSAIPAFIKPVLRRGGEWIFRNLKRAIPAFVKPALRRIRAALKS